MWGLFPRINCNSEDDVAFLHLGDVGTCQLEREIAWSKRVFKKSNLRGSDKQTERSELICVKGNTSVLRLYISYPIRLPYLISEFKIGSNSGPLFVFGTQQKMLKSLPKSNTYAHDKNHMQSNYFFLARNLKFETQSIWQEIIV